MRWEISLEDLYGSLRKKNTLDLLHQLQRGEGRGELWHPPPPVHLLLPSLFLSYLSLLLLVLLCGRE